MDMQDDVGIVAPANHQLFAERSLQKLEHAPPFDDLNGLSL